MRAALELARTARDRGEVPVGAVVVVDDKIVGAAHNETVARTDPTAHAEWLAIHRALEAIGSDRLTGATLYVTLEPCAQCGGAIVLTKVGKVVFGAWDEKAGMSGSIGDLLRHPRLNHRAEVIGGVLAAECGSLLQEFFELKRANASAQRS
jgi:tRNA(adenine34) deaminase